MTSSDAAASSDPAIRVLGLVGSTRRASFNRMLMAAAVELAPPHVQIDVFGSLDTLPFHDEDAFHADGEPNEVAELKAAITRSDALLIATPEHNFGVPAMLKNALDWASWPPRTSALRGKPIAIMGASPGMLGTARGQMQLRQSFVFTGNQAVLQPEVLVSFAADKFDAGGALVDQTSRKLVGRLIENLADLVRRLRPDR